MFIPQTKITQIIVPLKYFSTLENSQFSLVFEMANNQGISSKYSCVDTNSKGWSGIKRKIKHFLNLANLSTFQ